jgi:hypothetical protein
LAAHWTLGGSDQELAKVVLTRMQESPIATAKNLLLLFVGQTTYIVMATAGLSVGGGIVLIACTRLNVRRTEPRHKALVFTSTWAALACLSVMIASVLVSINNERTISGVALLFGRLNDSFAPLLICLGLLMYVPESISFAPHGIATPYSRRLSLAFLACAPLLLLATTSGSLDVGVGTNESVGLGFLGSLWQPYRFGTLALSLIALVMAVEFLLSKHVYWGIAGVVLMFLVSTNWALDQRWTDQRWQASRTDSIVRAVSRLGTTEGVSFDLAGLDPSTFWALQFLLPNQKHQVFNSARGEKPSRQVVVADRQWGQMQHGAVSAVASTAWSTTYPMTTLWATANSPSFASLLAAQGPSYIAWPSEMPSHTGRVCGLSREALRADKPDFLVFGPYLPLPPGEYALSVDYFVDDAHAQLVATWDVILDTVNTVARGEIRIAPGSSSHTLLRTTVRVPAGREQSILEFRLRHLGTARLQVNRLNIDPLL